MSENQQRIQAFLQRNNQTSPRHIPNRLSAGLPNRSPSPKKPQQSSPTKPPKPLPRNSDTRLTPQRVSTQKPGRTNEISSPRRQNSPNVRTGSPQPRMLDFSSMNQVQNTMMALMEKRNKLKERLKKQQQEEKRAFDAIKNMLQKAKKRPKNGEGQAEEIYKQKSEKIMQVVNQEASRVDQKIMQLEMENKELSDAFRLYRQNGGQIDSEEYLSKLFQMFEVKPCKQTALPLAKILVQRLIEKKKNRKNLEERAQVVIDQNQEIIVGLQRKVIQLGGKTNSDTLELN